MSPWTISSLSDIELRALRHTFSRADWKRKYYFPVSISALQLGGAWVIAYRLVTMITRFSKPKLSAILPAFSPSAVRADIRTYMPEGLARMSGDSARVIAA
jgi:hypothetical protein